MTKQVEAEAHLMTAARAGRSGRYQLEAAIQSVHAARKATGTTDWSALLLLYRELTQVAPSLGAQLGYAAAQAEACDPQRALQQLGEMAERETQFHQPYWALRGHLLERVGRADAAAAARARAIELTSDPAVRRYLART